MTHLLDTDTCIHLLRGIAAVRHRLESLSPDDCAISSISAFELFAGAEKSNRAAQEHAKIHALLEVIRQIPFDDQAALVAGKLRATMEKAGNMIGPFDLLIAAHALSLGLVLVSGNVAEFNRVSGLNLETWR